MLLLKILPRPLKVKVSTWIWQWYMRNLQNPIAFNPWERREIIPFLESIKGKPFDEFTLDERLKMRELSDLFTERGIRLIRLGLK